MMFFGGLIWILILGLIGWAVFAATQRNGGLRVPASSNREDALQILRTRFASGEIDAEEFKKRRRLLGDA